MTRSPEPHGRTCGEFSRRAVLAAGFVLLLPACAQEPPKARRRNAPAPSPSPSPTVSPTPSPSPTRPAAPLQPQHQLVAGSKTIVLTIDDGPDPRWTAKILRILGQHQVTATFFMLGVQAAAHPDLVRAVAADGHQIGTHTWSHQNLARLTPAAAHSQIERGVDAVAAAAGGDAPTLFRAPYGSWSPSVLAACHQLGQRPLGWSVDPRDWDCPGAGRIAHRVLAATEPGSIILLHDGGGDRSQSVAALRTFLPRLLAKGHRFTAL